MAEGGKSRSRETSLEAIAMIWVRANNSLDWGGTNAQPSAEYWSDRDEQDRLSL